MLARTIPKVHIGGYLVQRKEHAASTGADVPSPFPSVNVGGIPFAVSNLDHAVRWLMTTAESGSEGVSVRLANSYCIALAGEDERYRRLLTEGGVNFPDGAPVAAVMRSLPRGSGSAKAGRVRGPSFFEEALSQSRDSGLRHFFLGATPETLEKLERAVLSRHPGLQIAGTHAPPFAPMSDRFVTECADVIAVASPDLVWVGIGTPKQDFLTSDLASRTGKVCIGVGAAFDFSAGTVAEAPVWVQNSGFEWLYRLATEPKRLWRRYLVGNLQFIALVIRNEILTMLANSLRQIRKIRRPAE